MASERSFTVNWHSRTTLSKLNKQRMEQRFCDVILQVQNKNFHAHRSVLSACSEYFFKMFTINMKEKHSETVKFKDIKREGMEAILDFIYTEKIVITSDNVADILLSASIMQITDVLDVVSKYLSEELNCENCLYFRKIGRFHSLNKLIAETDQFIMKHFEEISQQDAFFELNAEELVQLFESDKLKVQEEQLVFEVIVKWISKSQEKRKRHFFKLFQNVRLQYVPIQYVAGIIRKDKLVREFPDCRDLVDDAYFYRIDPNMVVAEKPRKSYIPEPDSVLCVKYNSQQLFVSNVSSKAYTAINLDGWKPSLIKLNCALATKYFNSVFCGGMVGNEVSDQVVQFNGTRWSELPPMKLPRCGAAAVYYEDELYVFGGETVPIPNGTLYYNYEVNPRKLSDFAEDFETFSESWKIEGELKTRRSNAAAQVVDDEIYLIGGYTFNDSTPVPAYDPTYGVQIRCKEASKTTDVFNVRTRQWESGPVMRVARAQFGSTVLKSTVYVVGGYGSNGASVNGAEFMELASGVWTAITKKSPWSLSLTSACNVKDQIYLIGSGTNNLYRCDPDNQQWVQEQGTPSAASFVIPFLAQDQAGKK